MSLECITTMIDGLVVSFKPAQCFAARFRCTNVFRITGEGPTVPFQGALYVTGRGKGVAQVVIESDVIRADARTLA